MTPELQAFLLEHGFPLDQPDAPGANGLTPLMRAAKLGRLDLIDPLLAHGAKVEVLNQDGCNALWLACYHGDHALIRRLVAAGTPIDQQNGNGASCLMYVSSNGRAVVVELLLELGADPTLKNFDDWTAQDLASSAGCLRALRRATAH